jgi:hypothetical protein
MIASLTFLLRTTRLWHNEDGERVVHAQTFECRITEVTEWQVTYVVEATAEETGRPTTFDPGATTGGGISRRAIDRFVADGTVVWS